jgi:TolA-binding protein
VAFLTSAGLALSVGGCGSAESASYKRAFAEGERAETAGRYAEAAQHYESASKEAHAGRNRDHAELAAAMMMIRAGNQAEAEKRLRVIAEGKGSKAPDARYELAELTINRGEKAAGLEQMDAFVQAYPNHGLARPALGHILRAKDDQDKGKESLAYLEKLDGSLRKTELGETIAYEKALRLFSTGDTQGAKQGLLEVAKTWPYPQGKLFDDSLFRASEIEESQGNYRAAADHLERLLKEHEKSFLVGSYTRPRYCPALMRLGALYRDRLDNPQKAVDAFHRLYEEFPTSTLRDDALWEEAAVLKSMGRTGDSCNRLGTLVEKLKDSRYVPCAIAECPDLKVATGSRAPKECRRYLNAKDTAKTEPAKSP